MSVTASTGGQPPQNLVLPDDEHNRELVANVHPSGWTNPTPRGVYNLVAVGGGTAGLVSAMGGAGLGARTALIERHLMGGDCLNVGCVPSKSVIRAARAVHAVREAVDLGVVEAGLEARVAFAAAMQRMRRVRSRISYNDSARRFQEAGVDVFIGDATFTGPRTIEVGGQTLRFKKAVIATGGRAAAPPVPGLSEVDYLTNENVFSLTELPPRLLVIGAGPIGCELAQSFRRLGSAVTLFDVAPQILVREDADAAMVLQKRLVKEGITLQLGARIERVERRGGDVVISFKNVDGQDGEASGEAVLVAVGRKPNVDGLGLEAAGVQFDPARGVLVDDTLRTSNPAIYAAGDVCWKYQFTHLADFHARIVIQNALFPGRKKRASELVVPWCTYTDPEIAHVGLYEGEARATGHDVLTLTQPFDDVDRAILDGEDHGFARMHVDRKNGRILGATIVASHAGEMIGEMSVAITNKLTVGQVGMSIHPYPTQAEALRKLGDQFNRTRLRPWVKRAFERWFKWQR